VKPGLDLLLDLDWLTAKLIQQVGVLKVSIRPMQQMQVLSLFTFANDLSGYRSSAC
jgi:hypothetical protein